MATGEEIKEVTEIAIDDETIRLKILQDPNLLLNIIKEVQNRGVVGEENTILTLVNKTEMRLVKNKEPTSDNLIVSDKTGGGKDFTVKKTCEVAVPKNKYIHRTEISDKTFDYWQPIKELVKDDTGKDKPKYDTWDGYILHLEDPRDDALNGQSFKVMSSGGTEVTKIIDHQAQDIKVEGKPSIIVTSLKTLLDNENMRRWDMLRIDTTIEQTKEINKQKLLRACGKRKDTSNNNLIIALQTMLFAKTVIIPFAEKLEGLLPTNLLSRTQTDKLLDAIKASAVLHQYQRKKIDTTTVEANYFDLAYGWFVFTHLNSFTGIPMNRDEEALLKILLKQGEPVSISELSKLFKNHTKQWIYDNREKLANKGLIEMFTERIEYDHYSKDVEMITYGENASSILKDFKAILKTPDMIDFKEINDFKEICMKIDEERQKLGLQPSFLGLTYDTSLKSLKSLKSFETTILKSHENGIKDPQIERFKAIQDYCTQGDNNGNGVSKVALYEHFEHPDIDKLILDGRLERIPTKDDNELYRWGD